MFKKVTGFLLVLLVSVSVSAQKNSASKTKKILTANEWEHKYSIVKGKREELADYEKGRRLVFMPSREMIYEYRPGQENMIFIHEGTIEADYFKYRDRIEEPQMMIDMDKLAEGILVFSSEFGSGTEYVYEPAGEIKGKGYPAGKYKVVDGDPPMQEIDPGVLDLVKSINDELQKASGQLFFYDKNKERYLIKSLKFEPTEYGVRYTLVYDSKNTKNRSYSYEIYPESIDEVVEVKTDPDSRVGQLKLKMDNENTFYVSSDKETSLIKSASIDFYKESASTFKDLKKKFEDLSMAYLIGRDTRLDFIEDQIETGRSVWVSVNGSSNTYKVSAVDVAGNKLYIHYNLELVSLTDTKKGSYLTIVPLKEIADLSVEKTKSKPLTLLLHSRRKTGFETYRYSDGSYVPGTRVNMIPLFNYGELGWKQQRVEGVMKQLIRDDGGDDLKVTYNP